MNSGAFTGAREECSSARLIGLESTATQLRLKTSSHRKVSQGIQQRTGKRNFAAGWPLWWMCNTDTSYPTPRPPWSLADWKRGEGWCGRWSQVKSAFPSPLPQWTRLPATALQQPLLHFSVPSTRSGSLLESGLAERKRWPSWVTWRTYANQRLWANNQECRPWTLIINSASAAEYLALAGKRKV